MGNVESIGFYLTAAVAMLLAQFSPGPDMLLLLRTALHDRLTAGLWTVLGIATGLSFHCLVILLGFAAVLDSRPWLKRALVTAGAGYLLWIAYKLLKSVFQPAQPAGEAPQPLPPGAAYRRGLLTNLTNAKALFFLASFLALNCRANTGLSHRCILVAIIVGQATLGWSAFVWLLQKPLIATAYRRLEKPINLAFSLALIGLAGWGIMGSSEQ